MWRASRLEFSFPARVACTGCYRLYGVMLTSRPDPLTIVIEGRYGVLRTCGHHSSPTAPSSNTWTSRPLIQLQPWNERGSRASVWMYANSAKDSRTPCIIFVGTPYHPSIRVALRTCTADVLASARETPLACLRQTSRDKLT